MPANFYNFLFRHWHNFICKKNIHQMTCLALILACNDLLVLTAWRRTGGPVRSS